MPNSIVAEMQSKKWAMEPNSLKAFFERLAGLPVNAALPHVAVASVKRKLNVANGVAVIAVSGVLLKTVPGWVRLWGFDVTGYDEIASQIAEATGDDGVNSIHLQISSPGGMIDGLADTADSIFSARTIKPVSATLEDLGASAAYWLGSQAAVIDANRTAEIGSIGVFSVHYDLSKADEDAGIRVIVIRSGEHKAMGVDGVTHSQIAAEQETINSLADNFINAVATGRNKSVEVIRALATGRSWIAETALKLGLIDSIKEVVSTSGTTNENKGATIMKTDNNRSEQAETGALAASPKVFIEEAANAAATAAVENERTRMGQLQAEFNDDPEFAMKAFAAGQSLAEAKAAYCDVLKEKLKTAEDQVKQGKESTGAPPLQNSASGDSQGRDFIATAKETAKAEGIKLGDAFKKVAREQPELYRAYKESLVAA
jgi:signal peptide peptidase SppA